MRKFEATTIGIQQGNKVLFSDFEDDGDMWSGHGPRLIRQAIRFDTTFLQEPVVQVSLTMWDIAADANNRADISAEQITPDGFNLVFRTWGDTRVARVRAGWIAMGPVRGDDVWDV
ncbi:hypothetical protein EU805_00105 [Salipiger sp. IMCC34102]|uniref:H-type lectin domain-containing protein n=1 Tax=Salipiger sp. IMCC34102 TaxID=2510647 RepID=UPI00101B6F85|nr:H-type lectin domain-containing protein [Salipiger sp. IMCC34102]RYH03812.1 hypothetical protein EU805_00105 [Salipiger sp. IMCC34102]